ncbi:trypsin-like peptidase domain-containing protein [Salinibacterium sp. NSLL150]|uniref:S1C family serine protease n=1 Tax=unclassified Salinibacterium TaxID=2632331 RepID=UPI0018CF8357|nr:MULTISPECIES: trypsin-like peptidase domain-containing protein [unclassified Salinibacterium]MBH0099468.1 trypsin-like peptidase domain-containing protein [Salinibacterium sp. NSLL35]MBH0102222.1 trypsin-like peptidase domain-containing protein [Salinibacterium sp. NSLL150]MBH0104982.1 trypsin-like peptidase domain-containing protein [Salinibacterium sp. NSLL16]MBH0107742.1 trypsin-like peptidase domain-containing protein [Salinibacterium sp. NSLL17]
MTQVPEEPTPEETPEDVTPEENSTPTSTPETAPQVSATPVAANTAETPAAGNTAETPAGVDSAPTQTSSTEAAPSAAPVEAPPAAGTAIAANAATPSAPAELVTSSAATAPAAPTVQTDSASAEAGAHPGASFGPAAIPAAAAADPAAPKKKPRMTLGLVAGFAIVALLGGASGAGVTLWALGNQATSAVSGTASPASITVNDPGNATLVTSVVAKAAPAIVTINVTGQNAGGSGSGVIISEDGNVITNAHVVTLDGEVADPAVTVTTSDGRLLSATVIGFDAISDIAVIHIDDVSDMPFISIADSSELNVGDSTVAIGAPLGLSGTVTSGIVSALNRSITIASSALSEDPEASTEAPDDSGDQDLWNFDLFGENGQESGQNSSAQASVALAVIQTDAAINPGNSGGALLNSDGELIGINVAIASSGGTAGSIGVGFAIPSNVASRVANEILESGTATHGLLGAAVADVTDDPIQSDAEVVGASIVDIVAGGAAEDAGLKVGDIVTGFDGLPITNKTDLTAQVRAQSAGETTPLTYVRDGKGYTVDVTLGALQ